MRRYLLLLTPLLLLAVAACSQPQVKPGPGSITVAPESTAVQAGGADIIFTAAVQGVSDEVAWSLEPEVGTLSSASGTQVSYTPPASVLEEMTVVLTASAGDLSASASIELSRHVVRVNPATGSDSNDGSVDAPVKTIGKALTLAQAGSTVLLAGGTYSEVSGETFIAVTDNEGGYLVPAGASISADTDENGASVVIKSYGTDRTAFRFVGDGQLSSVKLEGFKRGLVATAGRQLVKDVTMLAISDVGVELEGSANLSCTSCNVSVSRGFAYKLDGAAQLNVDGESSINEHSPASEATLVAVSLAADSDAEALLNLGSGVSTGTYSVLGGTLTLQDVDVRLRNDQVDLIFVGPEGRLEMFGGRVSGGYFIDGGTSLEALTSYGSLSINGTLFEDNPAGALIIEGGSTDISNAIFQNIGDADTVFAGYGLNAITVVNPAQLKMRGTLIRDVVEAGNYSPPTPGTHGTGIYVLDASGGIDLGTAGEPGGNRFEECRFTCVNITSSAGAYTVQAVGNSWMPNLQGADDDGRYTAQLIDEGSFGRNFYVYQPAAIQF